jgi:malate/lactate dehydrogenase
VRVIRALVSVLDLAHGSQFTGGTDIVGSSDIEVARDSDIVVITAGAKQRAMWRADPRIMAA